MRNTHSFKMNLPEMTDAVDVNELNDNFLVIDDALMAGLCKKELTTNNMGSSDPASRKYGWAPWLEIYNGNDFDVVVIDRNAPDLPSGTINIEAGETYRMYINGTYYMNFYVQDQHDVTFRWFTNAETRINEIEPSGGGGVSSINVTGASGSHLETSGGPVTDSGTIEINLSTGYSIPSDEKQTEWDGKQDAISDLSTIRNGAASGATAVQPTALETALASKQDTISDLATIRSGASAGATAVQPATMSTALAAKQDVISDLSTIRSGASAGATALQPADVPSWAKQTNKPSYTQDEVSDGSTYKRVTQAEKDQIQYNTNNGVKNLFDITVAGFPTAMSSYDVEGTSGTISGATTPPSGAWARYRIPITLPAGTYTISGNVTALIGYFDLTGNTELSEQGTVVISRVTMTNTGRFSKEFTLASETSFYVAFHANYSSTGKNSSFTVSEVMISRKSIYDADSTFSAYSLSNAKLTPVLIEQVDNGAKNLLETLSSVTKTAGTATVTYTKDSNEYITASPTTDDQRTFTYDNRQYTVHLKPGSYVLMIDIKTASTSQYSSCILVNTSNTVIASSGVLQNKTGVLSIEFSITTEGDYGIVSKLFNGSWRIMICTLADWNVSQKFVPYRPNWDLVGSAVSALNSTIYNAVSPVYVGGSISITDITGGYIRIGNLVIVNIRCTAGTDIPVNTAMCSGLPRPLLSQSATATCVTNNLNYFISLLGTGDDARISNGSTDTIESGTILIMSCVYMAG